MAEAVALSYDRIKSSSRKTFQWTRKVFRSFWVFILMPLTPRENHNAIYNFGRARQSSTTNMKHDEFMRIHLIYRFVRGVSLSPWQLIKILKPLSAGCSSFTGTAVVLLSIFSPHRGISSSFSQLNSQGSEGGKKRLPQLELQALHVDGAKTFLATLLPFDFTARKADDMQNFYR